jgi:hypothetical protein
MKIPISQNTYKSISRWLWDNDDLFVLAAWCGASGLFTFGLFAYNGYMFEWVFFISAIFFLGGLLLSKISNEFDLWVKVKDSTD